MISLRPVERRDEATLRNLVQLYCHDMAEWLQLDAGEDGSYVCPLERLWTGELAGHLARIDGIPVGFALVGSAQPYTGAADAKDMTELFVVRRHRRHGVGRALATAVWALYPGPWLVRVAEANETALTFWRRAIAGFAPGAFDEQARRTSGRSWTYFTFAAPGR